MEQKIAQIAGVIVFILSVLVYVVGIYSIPIMPIYTGLVLLNIALVCSKLLRKGRKNFFKTYEGQ